MKKWSNISVNSLTKTVYSHFERSMKNPEAVNSKAWNKRLNSQNNLKRDVGYSEARKISSCGSQQRRFDKATFVTTLCGLWIKELRVTAILSMNADITFGYLGVVAGLCWRASLQPSWRSTWTKRYDLLGRITNRWSGPTLSNAGGNKQGKFAAFLVEL